MRSARNHPQSQHREASLNGLMSWILWIDLIGLLHLQPTDPPMVVDPARGHNEKSRDPKKPYGNRKKELTSTNSQRQRGHASERGPAKIKEFTSASPSTGRDELVATTRKMKATRRQNIADRRHRLDETQQRQKGLTREKNCPFTIGAYHILPRSWAIPVVHSRIERIRLPPAQHGNTTVDPLTAPAAVLAPQFPIPRGLWSVKSWDETSHELFFTLLGH